MDHLINEAWDIRKANFPDEIQFDFPSKTRAISVTGSECRLRCSHCNGRYLEAMAPIDDWQANIDHGITSCLISGGCDEKGKVPLMRYLPAIKEIKKSQRKTNLHVGLIDEHDIDRLTGAADVVSFDFVGDNETIEEVYGMDKTVDDYISVYLGLRRRVKVLPHICIGLRGGQISGEYKALYLLKHLGAEGLVFIVFSPTMGTHYADREPAALEEVAGILCRARIDFPNIPIHLGCMRPKGRYRYDLDHLALRCGVNKIVQPTPGAVTLAEEMGLVIKRGEECCVL